MVGSFAVEARDLAGLHAFGVAVPRLCGALKRGMGYPWHVAAPWKKRMEESERLQAPER